MVRPHTGIALLCLLLLSFLSACTIEQRAQVDADIDVIFTSVQPTQDGLQVAISYVNRLKEPIQFTLTYPQERAGFAADTMKNRYNLINATGMIRKHSNPNLDILRPYDTDMHSIFLLAHPNKKVLASFLFQRTTGQFPDYKEQPIAFDISISHYARPMENFDLQQPNRTFAFTATINKAKVDALEYFFVSRDYAVFIALVSSLIIFLMSIGIFIGRRAILKSNLYVEDDAILVKKDIPFKYKIGLIIFTIIPSIIATIASILNILQILKVI